MSLITCSREPYLGIREVPRVVGHLAEAKHRSIVALSRRLPIPTSGVVYILLNANAVKVKPPHCKNRIFHS